MIRMSTQQQKARAILVGGAGDNEDGSGSFFANVVRDATRLCPNLEIVGIIPSRSPEKSRRLGPPTAERLGIPYVFDDWNDFLTNRDECRANCGIIETNNLGHHMYAKLFTDAGMPWYCDKPTGASLDQAREMAAFQSRVPTAAGYSYTGIGSMRSASHLIQSGVLGNVIKGRLLYPQGWLQFDETFRQAQQRYLMSNAPADAPSCCFIDIGIHLVRMWHHLTGLRLARVKFAGLYKLIKRTVPPGDSALDDDCVVVCEFDGADGIAHPVTFLPSQVEATGGNNPTADICLANGSVHVSNADQEHLRIVHTAKEGPVYGNTTWMRGDGGIFRHPLYGKVFADNASDWQNGLPTEHGFGLHDNLAAILRPWADDVVKFVTDSTLPTNPTYATGVDGLTDWNVWKAIYDCAQTGKPVEIA